MTRSTLSSAARTQINNPVVYRAELIDIAFSGGTVYLTTGLPGTVYNGNTYNVQALTDAPVDGYTESTDSGARRISMKMSGLDATLRARILSANHRFANVNVTLAFFDASWTLVASYPLAVNRLLSNCALELDTQSASLTLSAESPQLLDARDSAVLGSPESQRLRYAGDAGLDRVGSYPDLQIEWGGQVDTYKNQRGGYRGGGTLGRPGQPALSNN